MNSTRKYLFTYGTLSPGKAPAEIAPAVRRLRRVGRGFVHGHLYDLGEYPGAVLRKTGPVILGQIFELPDDPDVLNKLDEYEGFDPSHPQGSLFVRKRWPVTFEGEKRKVTCWVYIYNRHPGTAPSIGSGDFSKARNHRAR